VGNPHLYERKRKEFWMAISEKGDATEEVCFMLYHTEHKTVRELIV